MTKQELLTKLNYNPDLGMFTWKQTPRRGFIGKYAGHFDKRGYATIRLNRKLYLVHHLVWLAETGELPRKEIDHINQNPSDNRFCNLRECSHAENMRNTKRHKERIGYSFDRTHSKWKVYVDESDKPRKNLGTVKTKEEAIAMLEEYKKNAIPPRIPTRSHP